jgi:hypothetical protein
MSHLFIYSFLVIHSECIGTCQIPTGITGKIKIKIKISAVALYVMEHFWSGPFSEIIRVGGTYFRNPPGELFPESPAPQALLPFTKTTKTLERGSFFCGGGGEWGMISGFHFQCYVVFFFSWDGVWNFFPNVIILLLFLLQIQKQNRHISKKIRKGIATLLYKVQARSQKYIRMLKKFRFIFSYVKRCAKTFLVFCVNI